MKRIFKVLIIILLVIVVSPVMAKEFTISDTDIKINIDESKWYTFTRDNIKDNKQLKDFGISEEKLMNTMKDGDIYLDSIKIKENNQIIEIFVIKKKVEKVKNISNYSDLKINNIAKDIAKKENTSNYKIYKTDYKYIYTKYKDAGKEIIDYYTVINGYGYTLKIQTDTNFTSDEELEIQNIIDTVSFNVDKSLKEPKSGLSPIIRDAIIGGITGALIGGVYSVINKNKKKSQ